MLDDSGYLDSLSGSAISDPIRLLTICDFYAALVGCRSYRPPQPASEALWILGTMNGKLEGQLVQAFAVRSPCREPTRSEQGCLSISTLAEGRPVGGSGRRHRLFVDAGLAGIEARQPSAQHSPPLCALTDLLRLKAATLAAQRARAGSLDAPALLRSSGTCRRPEVGAVLQRPVRSLAQFHPGRTGSVQALDRLIPGADRTTHIAAGRAGRFASHRC